MSPHRERQRTGGSSPGRLLGRDPCRRLHWRAAVSAIRRSRGLTRLTRAAGRALFDRAVRRRLRMSSAEFLRKWDAGEFRDPDSDPGVMEVVMLLPLVR